MNSPPLMLGVSLQPNIPIKSHGTAMANRGMSNRRQQSPIKLRDKPLFMAFGRLPRSGLEGMRQKQADAKVLRYRAANIPDDCFGNDKRAILVDGDFECRAIKLCIALRVEFEIRRLNLRS